MGSSIIGTAVSGLNAAKLALQTTSHNITNANTAGYSRQSIIQTTQTPQFSGGGFFGRGVLVENVRRSYDAFLNTQLQTNTARSGYLSEFDSQIGQINNLLSNTTSGVSATLNGFFRALQDVSAKPADIASRQSFLSSAQNLASSFQTYGNRLSEIRQGVNQQIKSTADTVNGLTSQIAALNKSIGELSNKGNGTQLPNDLLDQRDELIKQLNQYVKVNTFTDSSGVTNVFVGNGQPLVSGTQTFKLTSSQAAEDRSDISLKVDIGNGTQIDFLPNLIGGGKLSALFDFRDTQLASAQSSLGRLALVMGTEFNAQNQLGEDLNGNAGGNFFNLGTTNAFANVNNLGTRTFSVSVSDVNSVKASDYNISYDGTNYVVRRISDSSVVDTFAPPGSSATGLTRTIASEGLTLTLSTGTQISGDSYQLQPTRAQATGLSVRITDPSQVAAASRFRSVAGATNTGTGTIVPYTITNQQNYQSAFSSFNGFNITFTGTAANGRPQFTITDNASATILGTTTLDETGQIDVPNFGIKLTISGTPKTGDTFQIRDKIPSDPPAKADNRNMLALGSLQTTKLIENSASIQDGFAQMVAGIGSKAKEISVTNEAQLNLLAETVANREALSGVNLDEEAANLLKYQQAYQASGKVIQMANELFDFILQLK